jgi:hypothetical protein
MLRTARTSLCARFVSVSLPMLVGLSLHPAWAQQATLPAAVMMEQADDAADRVAQQRSDAAAVVSEGSADAAESVATKAADAADSMVQQSADGAAAAVPQVPRPLAPNPQFAHFPRYVGMLGTRKIELRLGKKTDDPTGVHGEYRFADTGEVVLVAGDREGDVLEIEDSEDGRSIAGNWVGRFTADGMLAGDRMNADDSDPQPFVLHPLSAPLSTR